VGIVCAFFTEGIAKISDTNGFLRVPVNVFSPEKDVPVILFGPGDPLGQVVQVSFAQENQTSQDPMGLIREREFLPDFHDGQVFVATEIMDHLRHDIGGYSHSDITGFEVW